MAEIDEQRIAELAKEPSRVLRAGGTGSPAPEEARRALEVLAVMRPRKDEAHDPEGGSR